MSYGSCSKYEPKWQFSLKLSFSFFISKVRKLITVKNATGIYSISTPNAYGGSNLQIASIDSIIVRFQQYSECRKYKIKFTSNPNPNNLFEFSSPSILQITSGSRYSAIINKSPEPEKGSTS